MAGRPASATVVSERPLRLPFRTNAATPSIWESMCSTTPQSSEASTTDPIGRFIPAGPADSAARRLWPDTPSSRMSSVPTASSSPECSYVTAQPGRWAATRFMSDGARPKPGLAGSPQNPENIGPRFVLFKPGTDFGMIAADVAAVLGAGLYMLESPAPRDGTEPRSDVDEVSAILVQQSQQKRR
jgi:hypothetical protein